MNHSHKYRRPLALASALSLLLSSAGCAGVGAGVSVRTGQAPKADAPGGGPHTAVSLMERTDAPLARSGWLELFLDDASKTVGIRSHSAVEWSTLPRAAATPRANAGACAVEAEIYANGHKLTLNSQDHSAAYGNAVAQNVKNTKGEVQGVELAYTLTPDAATAERAKKKSLASGDTAFLVRVQYTLLEGNLHVQADWENLSGNPNAFIATIGLMERFGALRNPGPNDFFLLPDGCGALLYPGRAAASSTGEDLRFAVYGSDPSVPGGDALRANTAVWGVRGQGAGFVAVVEEGAALCEIVARQSVPGEIPQSAVGPRFIVTPVAVNADGRATARAPGSYGGAFSVTYRFFNSDSANFNTMAAACREQLISIGVLSSTKSVRDDTGMLPLELTLLGTGPARLGQKTLTTYEQAQDILTRLKNKGVNSMHVRYQGALGWLQKPAGRVSPLLRLDGKGALESLQAYCKARGLTLFLDAQLYPAGGLLTPAARTIMGEKLRVPPPETPRGAGKKTIPLRTAGSFTRAARSLLTRLGKLETGGISLGDVGHTLYADYAGGGAMRMEAIEHLDALLPALSAKWLVMLDTGDFYAARHADVMVNLPLEPQLRMPGGRYEPRPLLPILLHGSADYSGAPLNLAAAPEAAKLALLRAIAYGACPAFTWTADNSDERLYFESRTRLEDTRNQRDTALTQLDDALKAYSWANAALAGLRSARITEYTVDPATGVSVTRYSNGVVVYVNLADTEKTVEEITIPPMDFVRIPPLNSVRVG